MSGASSASEQFAPFEGHRIYYQGIGSGDRAVVFLSGWGCDGSLWRNQAPALSPLARLLLLDLPGHGRSDKPDLAYTIPFFVRAVGAVLDHAQVEKAVVLGHSMGAIVAYEFARRHPARTIALVWVDGAFSIPVEIERQVAAFLARAQDLRSAGYKEKLSAFIDQLFVPETPAAVRDEVRQSIFSTPPHVLASCQESFAGRALFELEPLELPAFALFCAFWQPERFVEIFRKYLPRLEFQVLAATGHYPMLEKPDRVNSALTGFLSKIQTEVRQRV